MTREKQHRISFGQLDNSDISDTVKKAGGKGWKTVENEKEKDEDARIKQTRNKSTCGLLWNIYVDMKTLLN